MKKETKGILEIRGEVYMPTESFNILNDLNKKENIPTFINSRNAAAGSLRQKDSNITATRDLRLLSYQLINHEEIDLSLNYSKQLNNLKTYGFQVNNFYEVIVKATDLSNNSINQILNVVVSDVSEITYSETESKGSVSLFIDSNDKAYIQKSGSDKIAIKDSKGTHVGNKSFNGWRGQNESIIAIDCRRCVINV